MVEPEVTLPSEGWASVKPTAVPPVFVDKAPRDLSKYGFVSLLYISVCVCVCVLYARMGMYVLTLWMKLAC